MDHVPELWKDLKLEFNDNVNKKELVKSLIEEEKEHKHNIIKPEKKDVKKSQKYVLFLSHCIIS